MNYTRNLILLCLLLLGLNLKAQNKDSVAVANASHKFLKAFKDFDWITFKNCFSRDATIFFPEDYAKRKKGKNEIEATWKEIFPEFTDSTKKFDLKLSPQNLLIQLYGNSAVVTFHMGEETKFLARRSLVFIKEKKNWKIVHLHASGLKQ